MRRGAFARFPRSSGGNEAVRPRRETMTLKQNFANWFYFMLAKKHFFVKVKNIVSYYSTKFYQKRRFGRLFKIFFFCNIIGCFMKKTQQKSRKKTTSTKGRKKTLSPKLSSSKTKKENPPSSKGKTAKMQYYTINAAAKKLGHAWETVKKMIMNGKIQAEISKDGNYQIPESEIRRRKQEIRRQGKYYSISQAAKKTKVDYKHIRMMLEKREIEATKEKGRSGSFRIPENELPRIKELARQKKSEKKTPQPQKETPPKSSTRTTSPMYYSAAQVSQITGVTPHKIAYFIAKGKIQSTRKTPTSRYQIPESEIEKVKNLASKREELPILVPQVCETAPNAKEPELETPSVKDQAPETDRKDGDNFRAEFISMQNNLVETMRHIASTQEQMGTLMVKFMQQTSAEPEY